VAGRTKNCQFFLLSSVELWYCEVQVSTLSMLKMV